MAVAISCRKPNDGIAIQERSEVMIDDVYNARILDFAGNIPRIGMLEDADAEADISAPEPEDECLSLMEMWSRLSPMM